MMRIYTCVFEKSGAIQMQDVSAPWDRVPAARAVRQELELSDQDRLIALIPGQHTKRAWVFEGDKPNDVPPVKSKKRVVEAKKPHSGISLRDYIPNGF